MIHFEVFRTVSALVNVSASHEVSIEVYEQYRDNHFEQGDDPNVILEALFDDGLTSYVEGSLEDEVQDINCVHSTEIVR